MSTRKFEIDGEWYVFDFNKFTEVFHRYVKKKKFKIYEVEYELAEKLCLTEYAIRQWRGENNGPSDLEKIRDLADFFGMQDEKAFLKKVINEGENMKLTDIQKESLKRIYDSIIDFLDEFIKTDGFTTALWLNFKDSGIEDNDIENDIYEYVDKKLNEVHKTIKKEFFYLHDTEAYNEIRDYAYSDLYDIYDEKLGYAYRFEALASGNPTSEDDYNNAMTKLYKIVLKYI